MYFDEDVFEIQTYSALPGCTVSITSSCFTASTGSDCGTYSSASTLNN